MDSSNVEGAVYMGGETGRLPDGAFPWTGRLTGRDVKRDLAMYVYIS